VRRREYVNQCRNAPANYSKQGANSLRGPPPRPAWSATFRPSFSPAGPAMPRREIIERPVSPALVVDLPSLHPWLGIRRIIEQVYSQACVPKAATDRLDERVVGRFTGPRELCWRMLGNPRSGQRTHCRCNSRSVVVRTAWPRYASGLLQHSRRQVSARFGHQAFFGECIDDRQRQRDLSQSSTGF